jgi:hypothetical protein
MATIDLGKIKQVWRGTYNNGTAYVVDDLVAFTDSNITSTYICVANSTGNNPSSSGTAHASWNYVAKGVVDPIPSQSGNSGKFLTSNGSAASWADAGGGLQSVNAYTTAGSHTWTKPTGIKKIRVYCTGGGAGGMSGPSNDNPGSGGGAGGTSIKMIDVTSISSVAITIGAGGAGNSGTSGNRFSGGGGTSSFGSHCSATGGQGGRTGDDSQYGGLGGIGSGGDLNIQGGSGGVGGDGDSTNPPFHNTACSFWGGGGQNGRNGAPISQADMDGIHGGAGGLKTEGNGSGTGGAGLVYVENYK